MDVVDDSNLMSGKLMDGLITPTWCREPVMPSGLDHEMDVVDDSNMVSGAGDACWSRP